MLTSSPRLLDLAFGLSLHPHCQPFENGLLLLRGLWWRGLLVEVADPIAWLGPFGPLGELNIYQWTGNRARPEVFSFLSKGVEFVVYQFPFCELRSRHPVQKLTDGHLQVAGEFEGEEAARPPSEFFSSRSFALCETPPNRSITSNRRPMAVADF